MRVSFLTAAFLALSGAPTLAHAVSGSPEPAPAEGERSVTCAACIHENGGPKALEVSNSARPGEAELVELQRALDELSAATEAARQDEEEKRAEAERAAAVLRALETDLSRVEALLAESMADRTGSGESPALQQIGYAGEVPTGETSGAVQLRLVDLSDSGAAVLVPVDVREPAPSADERGYMGVTVADGEDGVTIASVVEGSPAEAAGLQAEDVLFNIGGASVVDMDGLMEAMSAHAAGDTVAVGIMRGKKPMRRRVTLGGQGVTRGVAPATAVRVESVPLAQREVGEEITLMLEVDDPRGEGARRIRLIRPDSEARAVIAIAGELEGEILEEEIEIEWVEHDEDDDCCGECGEHDHGEGCCGCEDDRGGDCCGCEDDRGEGCCGCEDDRGGDCCGCEDDRGDDCCGECGEHDHGEGCCGCDDDRGGDCCGCEDDRGDDCCGECGEHDHGEGCCGCEDDRGDDCCGECGEHDHGEGCCGCDDDRGGDCCGCEDDRGDDCCGECGEHDHGEGCCGCDDDRGGDCCGCEDDRDDDCCGECGEHDHGEGCCGCEDDRDDDCCGECGEHDHGEGCCGCEDDRGGDCCGECHDSHGHEGGHDPLPEGYEEIYERRETRSVHDGHEEEEIVTRRERRPVRHEGHDGHEDHGHHEWLDRDEEHGHHEGHDRHEGVGREVEELHQRIERLEREIEELTEALIDVRRAMDRRGRR